MSVSIATMGMYRQCCGTAGGGGAPPYRQNADERVAPHILVQRVEMQTKNSMKDYLRKIKVKLISFED